MTLQGLQERLHDILNDLIFHLNSGGPVPPYAEEKVTVEPNPIPPVEEVKFARGPTQATYVKSNNDLFWDDLQRQSRDKFSKQPINGDWLIEARNLLFDLPEGWRGTGEDMRFYVAQYIGDPSHKNVWGPLVRTVVENGTFVRTGKMVYMKSPQAHKRITPVYRKAA
jgi:hypothetical protein